MTVWAVLAVIVALGGVVSAVTGCMEGDRSDEAAGALEHDVLRLSRLRLEHQTALAVDEGEIIRIAARISPVADVDVVRGVSGGGRDERPVRAVPTVWGRDDGPIQVSVTVFSCWNDTTGAYACEPKVRAGACGYVLNPGEVGPGVTEPSLYAAAGPSWPCGTVFRFVETGQEVIVADYGNPYYVHDRALDVYCYDAMNRAMCLPGIGDRALVEVLE